MAGFTRLQVLVHCTKQYMSSWVCWACLCWSCVSSVHWEQGLCIQYCCVWLMQGPVLMHVRYISSVRALHSDERCLYGSRISIRVCWGLSSLLSAGRVWCADLQVLCCLQGCRIAPTLVLEQRGMWHSTVLVLVARAATDALWLFKGGTAMWMVRHVWPPLLRPSSTAPRAMPACTGQEYGSRKQ